MKKRNKTLIITAIVFSIAALLFLVIGFFLSGINIFEWLISPQALFIYGGLGIYGLIVLFFLVGDWIRRL